MWLEERESKNQIVDIVCTVYTWCWGFLGGVEIWFHEVLIGVPPEWRFGERFESYVYSSNPKSWKPWGIVGV